LPISRAIRACTAAALPATDRGSFACRCEGNAHISLVSSGRLELAATHRDEPRDRFPQPEPLKVAVPKEPDQERRRDRLGLGRYRLLDRLGRGRQLGEHVQESVGHGRKVEAVVQEVQE